MSAFTEVRDDCFRWRTFNYDADVDENIENSYRVHIRERDEVYSQIETSKRELRSGGRKKRRPQFHDEAHRRIVRDYFGYKKVLALQ